MNLWLVPRGIGTANCSHPLPGLGCSPMCVPVPQPSPKQLTAMQISMELAAAFARKNGQGALHFQCRFSSSHPVECLFGKVPCAVGLPAWPALCWSSGTDATLCARPASHNNHPCPPGYPSVTTNVGSLYALCRPSKEKCDKGLSCCGYVGSPFREKMPDICVRDNGECPRTYPGVEGGPCGPNRLCDEVRPSPGAMPLYLRLHPLYLRLGGLFAVPCSSVTIGPHSSHLMPRHLMPRHHGSPLIPPPPYPCRAWSAATPSPSWAASPPSS